MKFEAFGKIAAAPQRAMWVGLVMQMVGLLIFCTSPKLERALWFVIQRSFLNYQVGNQRAYVCTSYSVLEIYHANE